ncbi:MAG: hypothetical protein K8R12_06380, partial [Desulfobacterales bacterium]|nr:hypothetical protein [Desulfobacterales bacterium]
CMISTINIRAAVYQVYCFIFIHKNSGCRLQVLLVSIFVVVHGSRFTVHGLQFYVLSTVNCKRLPVFFA